MTADSDTQQADRFLAEVKAGAIALHPADTVPGLTCWPSQLETLSEFKGRRPDQSFLFLAATRAQALALWQPLPGRWPEALAQLWPGPLTVVFAPSAAGQKLQQGESLAVRVPRLEGRASWFRQVLAASPLPSTSANATGEPAATSWQAATKAMAAMPDVFVPALAPDQGADQDSQPPQPSTLIRIDGPHEFTTLRAGAIEAATIEAALSA